MEPFFSLGINVLSSIIYDCGKLFIKNNKRPLTEEQMLKIIASFQNEIECVFDRLSKIENNLEYIKNQNEIIFKLLLLVFDNNSDITISFSEKGYLIEGNYTLNNLNSIAQDCFNRYARSLPSTPPKNLSEAIWPIPHKLKGELLNEIENNLYCEDY